MIASVAPGCYVSEHQVAEGKNGIVIGTRAALAIDTGTYPHEGQAMADFIREQGGRPDRLLYTHGHGDHIFGSGAFADGEVFAYIGTPAVMREQRWSRTDQPEPRIAWPTVTFSDELLLDLGGKTVRVFRTPGHSEDGVSAYAIEDRVLFAGDSVVTGIVPAIGNGDSRVLEASLRSLAEIEIAVLVAGHGPVVHGVAETRAWIIWLADYLAAVRERVRNELAHGADLTAAVDSVDFATFIGDRLAIDRHGMPRRHRATVEKIVREEMAASS